MLGAKGASFVSPAEEADIEEDDAEREGDNSDEVEELPPALMKRFASYSARLSSVARDSMDFDGPDDEDSSRSLLADDAERKAFEYRQEPEPERFPEWFSLPDKYLTSNGKAYLTFFKSYVGAGILFLPNGFHNGGLTLSIVTMLITTYLATLCCLRVYYAKQQLADDFAKGNFHGVKKPRQQISFGMLARVAMGRKGRWLVDSSLAISQLGFCGAALIFATKNIASVMQALTNCDTDVNRSYLILGLVPFLIPVVWIRQLARFAFAILIADFFIIGGLIYIFCRNLEYLSEHAVASGITQAQGFTYFVFLGAALYALEGTAFVLPIELAMRNKQDFPKVVTRSTVAVGILYTVFGVVGYLAYGGSILTIITLNLQESHPSDRTVTVMQLCYAAAMLMAYPFTMYPAALIIESKIFKQVKSRKITWKKNLLRASLVLFTAGCAIIGADTFENFVGLIGGLACVPLTLIYPALFHLRICNNTPNERMSNIAIIVVGTAGCIAATFVSLYQWIEGESSEAKCVKI